MAFTVPWVPTGMKIGVSTIPCGVTNRPRRAREDESILSNSKDIVNRVVKTISVPGSTKKALRREIPRGELSHGGHGGVRRSWIRPRITPARKRQATSAPPCPPCDNSFSREICRFSFFFCMLYLPRRLVFPSFWDERKNTGRRESTRLETSGERPDRV